MQQDSRSAKIKLSSKPQNYLHLFKSKAHHLVLFYERPIQLAGENNASMAEWFGMIKKDKHNLWMIHRTISWQITFQCPCTSCNTVNNYSSINIKNFKDCFMGKGKICTTLTLMTIGVLW
jgi:hypothetical protein